MKAFYIGSATVDINAYCKQLEPTVIRKRHHLQRFVMLSFASKMRMDDISITTGGSAANAAVATKMHGTNVELLTAIGKDSFGDIILDGLRERRIPTCNVVRMEGAGTSVGINILSGTGEKTNISYKGSMDLLEAKHLDKNALKKSDALVCTSIASDRNWGLFTEAFKTARKYGKKTFFAPSIIMVRRRKEQFAKLKDSFDVAVMNREEASLLTGTHRILDALHELPGKLNVITCDADGTYVVQGGNVWHVPTIKVKVLDTTGAGDAFTGALVHGVLNHDDAVEAVKIATATACWNIMMPGARVQGTKGDILAFRRKKDGELKEKKIN